ncbi:MAG: DUF4097 family beta strand repeat-containing protein [Pyrinomonadaceae bacterium]
MSWLYTVIFAGLVLSSNGDPNSRPGHSDFNALPETAALQADETETFERSYPLNANGRVNISNINGSITVEAWDRNEVKLQYTKVADSKERLADVNVKIESRQDYFGVETGYWKGPNANNGENWRRDGKLNVEFRLSVPKGAVLNEIETVNGSVTISNFTNFCRVSAVNGSVKATNIRGAARLSTVNGEVAADFDRLETGSKINLDTVNGTVNLMIPSDSNATVKADSLNGNITNDFGLPVRKGKYIGRDLYGKLGSGEIQIKLNSVNGGLAINRKNDGKSLSPATNLLPQKTQDDDDWGSDNDGKTYSAAKVTKMNRDIEKAVNESQKNAAAAIAEAQKEMALIQPEIARIAADSAMALSAEAIRNTVKVNSEVIQQSLENARVRMADIGFGRTMPRVEKKSNSFPVKGTPKVTVNAPGCSVKVTGWDRSEVQYRVVQFADSRTRDPLNIREEKSDSAVTITVEDLENRTGSGRFFSDTNRIRVELMVPRKSNLKVNADGELRVEGVSGDVELIGSDEPISVRDMEGKLRVSNSDGLIRVIGFKGEIDARTSDGTINLEGDFQKLNAQATDGSISLNLPENTSADLEANCDALKGEGIELTQVGTTRGRSMYRIGSGGPPFRIETGGEISVRGSALLRQN